MRKYSAIKLFCGLPVQAILFIICFLLLPAINVLAQSRDDIELVKATSFYTPEKYYKRPGNSDSLLNTRKKNVIAAYNPLSLVMKGSMYLYQHVLTQQLSRTCPYEITCSNFSKQAIQRFGLIKGTILSADRILRCNRISVLDISPLDIDQRTGAVSDDLNKYR